MEIIYLHGFNSSGDSKTAQNLRNEFPGLISPSYDYIDCQKAHEQLSTLIHQTSNEDIDIVLVGTSLGGFWALYFAQLFNLSCVVNNPALRPWISLNKYVGVNKNFSSGEERMLTPGDVAAYKQFEVPIKPGIPRTIVLGKNDETLNYQDVEAEFKGIAHIIYTEEGHRIEDHKQFATIIEKAAYTYTDGYTDGE